MPGAAVPVIDESTGLIREYPSPVSPHQPALSALAASSVSSSSADSKVSSSVGSNLRHSVHPLAKPEALVEGTAAAVTTRRRLSGGVASFIDHLLFRSAPTDQRQQQRNQYQKQQHEQHRTFIRTAGDKTVDLKTIAASTNVLDAKLFRSDAYNFSEDFDYGHRHFSGLHWLYPNTFLPYTSDIFNSSSSTTTSSRSSGRGSNEWLVQPSQYQFVSHQRRTLLNAARRTLNTKLQHGGAHTGWSAAWAACLSARLGDGDGALAAIARLLSRFTAPNMLSLHPPLDKRSEVGQCPTAFAESKRSMQMRLMRKRARREQLIQRAVVPHRGDDGQLHFLHEPALSSTEVRHRSEFRSNLEGGMQTDAGEKVRICFIDKLMHCEHTSYFFLLCLVYSFKSMETLGT